EEEEEGLFKGTKLYKLIKQGSVRDHKLTYRTKSGENILVSFSGSVMYESETDKRGVKTRVNTDEKDAVRLPAADGRTHEGGAKRSIPERGARRIVGIVGVARDMRQTMVLITDLEKSKKELEEFSRNLEKKVQNRTKDLTQSQTAMVNIMEDIKSEQVKADGLRDLAEGASNAKSQFLANMSHEIRTPMNAIIGFVALLKGTKLNKQQKEYLDTITSSGQVLLNIISDILDLAKIEAGEIRIEHRHFNLEALIKGVLTIVKPEIGARPIKVYFNIENDVPPNLGGDFIHLRQVFTNLLNNAIKFTEKGEISLSVRIEKKLDDQMRLLRFTVKDTGIGIPKDKGEFIFDTFTQVDSVSTREYPGTGLGLSICKAYVKSMGGNIWVESELGKGSQFIFTAQFKETSQGVEEETYPVLKETEQLSCEGIRVLAVEDNLVNQKLVNVLLKNWGCVIDLANNGHEAVEKVKENKYDLVLMDLLMPVMDGLQATRIIRKDISKDLPIIALTAAAMEKDEEKGLSAGINDYLLKPIEPEKLKEIIFKWGRRRANT
ncbi:MAG: ATP-binding protein, partial [Thermodesulfobacteriota bacterium]